MRRQPKAPLRASIEESARGRTIAWRFPALTVLVVAVLVAALGASPAQAADSYENSGSFGQGEIGEPRGIAVDNSTGDVLVVDCLNARVAIFEGGGPGAALIGEIPRAEFSAPWGIAIDQSNGDVYVGDTARNTILRFVRTATSPPAYAPDPTWVSPAQGTGPGQIGSFRSPLAVDPTNGDLLVADTGNQDVARYTDTGAFVDSFDGSGSEGGAFTGLLDLTFDPTGHIYTVDGTVEEPSGGGEGPNVTESRVQKFSAAGAPEGSIGSGELSSARSVVFDPASGNLIVAVQGEIDPGDFVPITNSVLMVYQGGVLTAKAAFPESVIGSAPMGLAIGGILTHNLYALTSTTLGQFRGASTVQVFEAGIVPDVVLDPPSEVQATSAHVSGTVNPSGKPTTAYFEYTPEGGAPLRGPEVEVGEGEAAEEVSVDLADLIPNLTYTVRLVARNEAHTTVSDPTRFTTLKAPPKVVTGPSTEVTDSAATVNGSVSPFGLNATYHFEYGTTTGYGLQSPPTPGVAGNGYSAHAVSRLLSGLQPGTTYHYRLVGENSIGISIGSDQTFTTLPSAAAETRVYEQVTPVEKALGVIASHGFQARSDGEALLWSTDTTMNLPQAESAPKESRYASFRGPGGWALREVDPRVNPAPQMTIAHQTLAISNDFSRALVTSNVALTPGAIEGGANLYLRDLATGKLTFVAAAPTGFDSFAGATNDDTKFIGGTSNFSSIVFDSPVPMTPEATPGISNLYRWSNDKGLELVTVMPDGHAATLSYLGRGPYQPESKLTSADTRRTIFSLNGGGIYARVDGDETVALSKSRVPGEPEEPQPGYAYWVSQEGRSALFAVTSAVPLTADAPVADGDLYEYEFATGEINYLGNQEVGAPAGEPFSAFAVSDDGRYVYLLSLGELYLVHEGDVTPIAAEIEGARSVSPNGRYLAFQSPLQLTDYNNEGHQEIYVYDAPDEELTCASCPRSGGPSTGDAQLSYTRSEIGNSRIPKAVTNEGEAFFDTPTRLIPSDTNAMRDVYAYREGAAQLISPGNANFDAVFVDASANGRDVFFETAQSLVRQDDDHLGDIYDARVGGGIAAQNLAPPVPCTGEGCRAAAPAAPAAPGVASQSVHGQSPSKKAGKKKSRQNKSCQRAANGKSGKKCAKHKKKHHKTKSSKRATRRQGR